MMHQNFPSINSQFSEMYRNCEPVLLKDSPKYLHLLKIDKIIEAIFAFQTNKIDTKILIQELKNSAIEKQQFFSFLKKSVAKHLKKNQLSVQCVIGYYKNRTYEQSQQPRSQTLKILNDFLKNIEAIGVETYHFICDMQSTRGWGCKCDSEQCQARKSLEQFHIDIFLFLIRSSQIITQQMKISSQNINFHLILPFLELVRHQNNVDSQKLIELKFQLETVCEQPKNKKKRKNKKLKNRIFQQQKTEQIQQDQKLLTNYLQKLNIVQQERAQCIVSQQWLQKIRPECYLFKK